MLLMMVLLNTVVCTGSRQTCLHCAINNTVLSIRNLGHTSCTWSRLRPPKNHFFSLLSRTRYRRKVHKQKVSKVYFSSSHHNFLHLEDCIAITLIKKVLSRTSKMGFPVDAYSPSAQDFMVLMQALSKPATTVRRRQRRVRFSSSILPCNEDPVSSYNDVRKLWYGKEDIAAFKAQMKEHARQLAIGSNYKQHAIERRRHKLLSVQCTLSAQSQGLDASNTALVSQKCSEWSNEIAKLQGWHDYYDAYFPSLVTTLPKVTTIRAIFPFQLKQKKRACPDDESTKAERCVRRRTVEVG